MDDFEYDDVICPFCGQLPIHFQECDCCNDGYTDSADEDSVNYTEGEKLEPCFACRGQGHIRWCPKCGKDIWDYQVAWEAEIDVR